MKQVVLVSPHASAEPVRRNLSSTVPSRFSARVELAVPEGIRVDLDVEVVTGGKPVVREFAVTAAGPDTAPLSTATLRAIAVEHLLGVVVDAASSADTTQADHPVGLQERRAALRARDAAGIYRRARSQGNWAPTEAVAVELGVSRSQASRYVRRARDMGLLPAVGGDQ